MKAVRIRGYGNEPAIDDIAMPEPTEGEVLMQVQAAALNPLDIQLQAGYLSDWFPLAFPFTLGTDFAGVVKRYHFAGGPKTHGQSDRHRAPGSIGASSTPGRVFKGMRMAGLMFRCLLMTLGETTLTKTFCRIRNRAKTATAPSHDCVRAMTRAGHVDYFMDKLFVAKIVDVHHIKGGR